MPSLKECMENVDELAQKVLNVWGEGDPRFTEEFKALYQKANQYLDAKSLVDNNRNFGALTDSELGRETETREIFARDVRRFIVVEDGNKRHLMTAPETISEKESEHETRINTRVPIPD